jgi:hypothetical protein
MIKDKKKQQQPPKNTTKKEKKEPNYKLPEDMVMQCE